MKNCQHATRLMSDSQERTLSFKESVVLKMHLMMCSSCRHFGKHMNILHDTLQEYAKGKKTKLDDGLNKHSIKDEPKK